MKIARVFPQKTSFSPTDEDCYFGPPGLFTPKYDEVHISVVFTWDKPIAEKLAVWWSGHGKVLMGGPAYGDPGAEFSPNMYTGKGVVITHRGCVRSCPWCYVPKREGRKIRHLEVKEGNILQDNNILACNREHKEKVWAMLRKQKRVSLRGGLDSRLLKEEDIDNIRNLNLFDLWTAYDSQDNEKALDSIIRLRKAGISQNKIRCYVLVGFGEESMADAESRLKECYLAGALPFAQLYDGRKEDVKEWKRFARKWSRPAIYKSFFPKSGNPPQ